MESRSGGASALRRSRGSVDRVRFAEGVSDFAARERSGGLDRRVLVDGGPHRRACHSRGIRFASCTTLTPSPPGGGEAARIILDLGTLDGCCRLPVCTESVACRHSSADSLGHAGSANPRSCFAGGTPPYGTAFMFTAAMLVLNQTNFLFISRDVMARSLTEEQEMTMIAAWMRANLPEGTTVESERPGFLAYQMKEGARVLPPGRDHGAPYLLTSLPNAAGYRELHRPAYPDDPARPWGGTFGLFRRLGEEARP
jgi:hypothetical protein